MHTNHPARYCRCGIRLARDNTGGRCGACQDKARSLTLQPPHVPDDFWDTEHFRDAFTAQHIGHVSRAYRKHPWHIGAYGKDGIPQQVVARWMGITQAQVSRIENGPAVKHLDSLAHWARTLGIPAHRLWFALPGAQSDDHDARSAPGSKWRVQQDRRGLVAERPLATQASCIRSLTGEHLGSAMQSFRAADRQVGGSHLYATVVKYLYMEIAPRLFGMECDSDSQLVFTAAAALTEMAGWMAHDAGRDQTAEQHFARSFQLVRLGCDRQLSAHVLASMSHLAHHRRRPADAIQLAQRGLQSLAHGPRLPELEARLLAMQARGFAGSGSTSECAKLMRQAESALTAPAEEERSPWVSRFDEGSLASETAHCLCQLGDFDAARRDAQRIIELRPRERTRSRAFGHLILATTLIAQGKPDEACSVAQKVLEETQQLGSYLVNQQLLELRRRLEPFRRNQVVSDFLHSLEVALRDRLWLQRWLTREEHNQPWQRGDTS